MNIVVLGSGGWGTAAAMLLSDNGHTVALWSHDPKKVELLDKTRENPLLKGVRIPERIAVTSDLAVLQNAEMASSRRRRLHCAPLRMSCAAPEKSTLSSRSRRALSAERTCA